MRCRVRFWSGEGGGCGDCEVVIVGIVVVYEMSILGLEIDGLM